MADVATIAIEVKMKGSAEAAEHLRGVGTAATGAEKSVHSLYDRLMGLGGGTLGKVLSVAAVTAFGMACFNASIQMDKLQKSYQSIMETPWAGTAQLDFVYATAQKLGLQFQDAAASAKTFFASAKGTTLEVDMNRIFKAVSTAGSALSLSSEEMQGAFLALGQMISKGKVQAEELRGQLGERLPGAFRLAADAMGMGTAELDKFMADGKLTAEDLLPKLADALEKKYGEAAKNAADGAAQAVNRMSTEWTLFKANVLGSDTVVAMLRTITGALRSANEEKRALKDELRLDAAMTAAGMQKRPIFDPESQELRIDYTDEQKRYFKAVEEAWAAHEQHVTSIATKAEKTRADARSTVNDAVKHTTYGKIKAENGDFAKQMEAFRTLIEERKVQNVGYEDLLREQAVVEKSHEKKLESLKKKDEGRRTTDKTEIFATNLERMRQELANLEAAALPAVQGIEAIRAKLALERDNALATAEAHALLAVQRKQATPQQAEEMRGLESRKAELVYTNKMGEAERKNVETRANFYRELGRLSGEYSFTLEYQNEMIRKQGEEYRRADVPGQLVAQWEALQRLETARDPLSGSVRGLRKFSSEAGDLAKGFENVFTTSFQSASDALTDFVMGADVDLNKLGNSFVRMFAQIAAQQAMGGIASGLGSLLGKALGGWLGGGSSSTGIGSSGWTGGGGGGWATGGWDSGMSLGVSSFHSGGLAGMGGASDRALPFSVFENAPRFHNGGGYFREDEYPAVLQYGERVLNRRDTAVFDAAMSLPRAPMPAVQQPVPAPIINVYNTAKGTEARAEAQQQPDGSFKIDVIVEEVDRRMAQRVTSGTSHTARAMDSTRGMSPAPAAYRG